MTSQGEGGMVTEMISHGEKGVASVLVVSGKGVWLVCLSLIMKEAWPL